ncbi:pseudouridine synthase [Shewanella sp. Arc9-LZ]|nr:pseudouridine synthase [Shewanella sp. Arc9-LZ]
MTSMRLSHYLAVCGVASRRQAARLIDSGRVSINHQLAKHTDRVNLCEIETILVDDKPILAVQDKQYWLYHKPVGIDCRLLVDDPHSLLHVLPELPRLYPAGRLDKDSRGLLLLTNDGQLTQALMHPDYYHPKTYVVQVDKPISASFLLMMTKGVSYGDVQTRPCEVRPLSLASAEDRFEIVLTQGLNRQIRRMCKALGYKVIDLMRTQLLDMRIDELAEKTMRPLTAAELLSLKRAVN